MTHRSKSISESHWSLSTSMTVGHIYPSDYLVLLPDLLSKSGARTPASTAPEDRGSSTAPLPRFWCPPTATSLRPLPLTNVTVHPSICECSLIFMFKWHPEIPVIIPLPADVALAFYGSLIMEYFPSRKYANCCFLQSVRRSGREGVEKFRPRWYCVVNNTYWCRDKPTLTAEPWISGAVTYITVQAYNNHLK